MPSFYYVRAFYSGRRRLFRGQYCQTWCNILRLWGDTSVSDVFSFSSENNTSHNNTFLSLGILGYSAVLNILQILRTAESFWIWIPAWISQHRIYAWILQNNNTHKNTKASNIYIYARIHQYLIYAYICMHACICLQQM